MSRKPFAGAIAEPSQVRSQTPSQTARKALAKLSLSSTAVTEAVTDLFHSPKSQDQLLADARVPIGLA